MKPYAYAKHRVNKCSLSYPIRKLAKLFAEENIGSVLVKNEDGKYVGLLTDKVLFKAIADGSALAGKKVSDLRLESIVYVRKDADLDEVIEKFNESDSGRLVMQDSDGNVVGILKRKNIERFSEFRVAKTLVRR